MGLWGIFPCGRCDLCTSHPASLIPELNPYYTITHNKFLGGDAAHASQERCKQRDRCWFTTTNANFPAPPGPSGSFFGSGAGTPAAAAALLEKDSSSSSGPFPMVYEDVPVRTWAWDEIEEIIYFSITILDIMILSKIRYK